MKFTTLAIASLIGLAQSVQISREAYANPAYNADHYDVYTSSEQDDFNKDVAKAKIDTVLYQAEHGHDLEREAAADRQKAAEAQALKEKQAMMAKGKIMVDGLLHTPDGKAYFQDGSEA